MQVSRAQRLTVPCARKGRTGQIKKYMQNVFWQVFLTINVEHDVFQSQASIRKIRYVTVKC